MRKLIMWNVISLDGYFEGGKAWDLGFHETVFAEELQDYSVEQLESADMLVFGRKTYEGMMDYWTTADGDEATVASYMNTLPKVLCSRTLTTASWNNTMIVKDAIAEISALKAQGDGNMFVFGSGILSESLMKAGLFDEYRLCIAPILLGDGRKLFEVGLPHQTLSLLEARALQTGGVIVKYRVA